MVMQPMKRAVHIDFHTMPGITNFGEEWDAKAFAKRLKDANVTYINAFAQCNIGFSYYPTKIGIPYPGMSGDMFGSLLEECHKVGIRVTAYLNVGLNHELARHHADWLRVDREGRIIRGDRTANFFRTMCYNTGYHDYLLDTIREICAYDVDGIFCDCMGLEPCYCDCCIRDMLSAGVDITDENAVRDFAYQVMLSISKDIREVVPSDKFLYLNGMPYYDVKDYDSHIEIECLPSGGWGYDYFWAQASYARNIQKNVLYMTGRFQASWGDFGGYKTKESIENDFYDALCNNIGVSLGDHMHPAKNLEKDIYTDLGDIYQRIKSYEPWTDEANYCADIGVITTSGGFLSHSYMGLARMLAELKYSFEIIHETMDFDRFSVLILPDDLRIDDLLAKKLQHYLASGKKIIASGFSGLKPDDSGFAMPEEWDFVYKGKDESNSPYFHLRQNLAGLADMDWAMYQPGICVQSKDDRLVIADYVEPYFNRKWDGMHGYFYTPPKSKNGDAAVLLNDKANIAQIVFRIFDAYYEDAMLVHKELVRDLLKRFLPIPLIRADELPSTARATVTAKNNNHFLHIKVTYPEPRGKFDIVEEHNVLTKGHSVAVRGHFTQVLRLPEQTPINFQYQDGYTVLTLPEITGYDMFLLK